MYTYYKFGRKKKLYLSITKITIHILWHKENIATVWQNNEERIQHLMKQKKSKFDFTPHEYKLNNNSGQQEITFFFL